MPTIGEERGIDRGQGAGAGGVDQLVGSTWTPSFYGYDALGSVRQLTSSTGAVTDTYDYDAWGNAVNTTGSTPNVYLYRGEQFDSDLNLYYLRARYFNPVTGRFLSRDPAAGRMGIPATRHKYLYASADPVNRVDPSGWQNMEFYGIRLAQSVKAGVALGAMGCGVSLGAALAVGTLNEALQALGEDPIGTALAGAGCVTAVLETTGGAQVAVNLLGVAACGWGLYQAYNAENEYFKDLAHPVSEEKTALDYRKMESGVYGSIIGCGVTVLTLALE